jgi:hypothetical protein
MALQEQERDMALSFTAQERRIIGSALPSMEGTSYQPAEEDLEAASALIGRGLLTKRAGWDVLDATPEAQEMYWADRDDIDERNLHEGSRVLLKLLDGITGTVTRLPDADHVTVLADGSAQPARWHRSEVIECDEGPA